jgi:hypothetical protein
MSGQAALKCKLEKSAVLMFTTLAVAAADLQALAEQLDLAEAEQEEVLVEVQVMLILEAAQAEETLA